MNNLLVVRHGSYIRETGKLSDYGKQQVEELSQVICNIGVGKDCYFACSKADRATESASILISKLNNGHSLNIWDELFDIGNYLSLSGAEKIHERVGGVRDKADTLVLVSHFSVATGYSSYFMQEEFNRGGRISKVPTGRAVFIDLLNKDYDIIPK